MHNLLFSFKVQKSFRFIRAAVACLATAALVGAQAQANTAAAPQSAPARSASTVAASLALGADFSCAVTSTGQVKCWGNNRRFQLTEGVVAVQVNAPALVPGLSGVSKLAAGEHHACAIATGGLNCWGASLYGQIGHNPSDVFGPLTGIEHFPAYTDTRTTARLPVVISLGGTASDIAIGDYHTCAVVGGGVKCWGRNHSGEIGDGTIVHRALPTPVSGLSGVSSLALGDTHSCALLADQTVRCWGNNMFGQLGNGSATNSATAVAVSALSGATAIAAGSAHTCAISGGAVQCWGLNQYGQLGAANSDDSNVPVAVSGISSAIGLAAGEYHTCALLSGGSVQCWGRNNNGQLGNNALSDSNVPVSALGVASGLGVYAGDNHSCVVTTLGDVQCWGRNNFGQLGDSSTATKLVPVNVTDFSTSPTTPPAVTPTSTPTPVVLAGIRSVTAGRHHSCANVDGAVQCWGGNANGQLGDNTIVTRSIPAAVFNMANAVDLAGGGDLTCATTDVGEARCWGEGSANRVADGGASGPDRLVPSTILGVGRAVGVGAGTLYHQCVRQENGEVLCWGQAIKGGEVGDGSGDVRALPVVVSGVSNASQLSADGFHSCVVVQRGAVKCWGSNELGQIGDGSFTNVTFTNSTYNNRYTPVYVKGVVGATDVDTGLFHSCALMGTGTVKCWGYNVYGQLGDGTASLSRTLPVDVVGIAGAVSIAAGNNHTCAVVSSGAIMCWGRGFNGQLGNGYTQNSLTPVTVLGITNAVAVASSQDHTCAILTDGQVRCWGNNASGQLAADPTVYPNSAIAVNTSNGQPLSVVVPTLTPNGGGPTPGPTITPGGPTLTPTPRGGWGGKLWLPLTRRK